MNHHPRILLKTQTAFILYLIGLCLAPTLQGVIGCISRNDSNQCILCYKRKVSGTGGCGAPMPKSDPCLIYTQSGSCNACKPGYKTDLTTRRGTCRLGAPKNCALYVKNSFKGKCVACLRGYYLNKQTGKCDPTASVPLPAKNCYWGGAYSSRKQASCFYCDQGYSNSIGSGSKVCKRSLKQGCAFLSQDGSTCEYCDFLHGWFMLNGGVCRKLGFEVSDE